MDFEKQEELLEELESLSPAQRAKRLATIQGRIIDGEQGTFSNSTQRALVLALTLNFRDQRSESNRVVDHHAVAIGFASSTLTKEKHTTDSRPVFTGPLENRPGRTPPAVVR